MSQQPGSVQPCTPFASGTGRGKPCPGAAAQPPRDVRNCRVVVGPVPFVEADLWASCSPLALAAKANLLSGDHAGLELRNLSGFASGGMYFLTPTRGELNLALAGPCN